MRKAGWRRAGAAALLAGLVATSAHAQATWQEIKPGGATSCARGDEFAFFVKAGDPAKVVVDFVGGGACWDAETCAPETATFTDNLDPVRDMAEHPTGIYRPGRADNPYDGWTHVVVPYCTGDVHWGQRDVTYRRANGSAFTIRHRGAINTRAVLDWMSANVATPERLFVTGCSAGAYGSVYWMPHLREMYPRAAFAQLGDSGAGVLTPEFLATTAPLWNIEAAAPRWIPELDPANVDYTRLTLDEFYVRLARHYPEARFAQFNHAEDFIQRFFYMMMGGDPEAWGGVMRAGQSRIRAESPNYRYFTGVGDEHCATVIDEFYTIESDGVRLKNWIRGYMDGAPTTDVTCEECDLIRR